VRIEVKRPIEGMDLSLNRGQARPVRAHSAQTSPEHPAIQAMDPTEREVWVMHVRGLRGAEIAQYLNLGQDRVSRVIHEIRRRLQYLARLRELMVREPAMFRAFVGCRETYDCSAGLCDDCPARGLVP